MTLETTTVTNQPETPYLEEEELEFDLTTLEGIRGVLKEAEKFYAEAVQYEEMARKENFESLKIRDVAGVEVLLTMYRIMADLRTLLRAEEATQFTELDIARIKDLYNELYLFATYITSQYELTEFSHGSEALRRQGAEEEDSTEEIAQHDEQEEKIEMFGRQRRGDLNVVENQEEEIQKIQIIFKEESDEEESEPVLAESVKTARVNQPYAEARGLDPVVKTVPMPSPGVMRPAEKLQERSLTGQYLLGEEEYRDFIEEQYSSPVAFERFIDMKITKFEARATDVFERWLGEEFQSPFLFLQDKSVAEVIALSQSREVRKIMSENQIKYEAFVAWTDLIEEMQEVVELDTSRTFGELVARWFIESEMADSLSTN